MGDSAASHEITWGMLHARELGPHPLPLRQHAGACALMAALLLASACDGSLGGGDSGSGASAGTGAAAGSGSGNGGSGGDPVLTTGSSTGGTGTGGGACGSVLPGIVRDFVPGPAPAGNPDFEGTLGEDYDIVLPDLGPDGKPVYAPGDAGTTPTTNGKAAFDQWYRDVPGTNFPLPLSITLSLVGGGVFTYNNPAFFPIDGEGFGDYQDYGHNYHFTLELHTQFEYRGGEVFTFTGDDDLFTFINGKLAINLGGVHGALSQTVDLDAQAAVLGITVGNTYPLDFFFAERHTTESNFRIDTTISCFSAPPE